jgi:poly(3-hydroxybutyrate) depolymerase
LAAAGATLLMAGLAACAESRVQLMNVPAIHAGKGNFTFDGYGPLSDRPIRVYYEAPSDPTTAQILIVMHGVGRNAADYREDWTSEVNSRNVLVLAPEFSERHYPGHSSYSLGNMADDSGRLQPSDQWTFHVIEALFDYVVHDVGSPARDYSMFGHSAGTQFVHRFIEFMPRHRARAAVAANPGWYTMPDDSVPFPYGLEGSPEHTSDLGPAFASNLILLLGDEDTDPDDESLRHDEQSDAQGEFPLERGENFFRLAQQVATRDSLPFRWRKQIVGGVAHDHTAMSAIAAPLLLGNGS